jgi:hypothetical protein
LVLDEIKLREKRFKWLRDRKRDWDRVNNRYSIMRKLNDELIMMNSLFILVKFQMDFTLEYYKNKNISPEEWSKLWKLMTSFKEYTSYTIPNEVFMTIQTINAIMEAELVNSKNAMMALGDVINELNDEDEQMVEMKNLNETTESSADTSAESTDEPIKQEQTVQETSLGGKNKQRKFKTRKFKTRKFKTRKFKTRKFKTRKFKTRKFKTRKNRKSYKKKI